MKIAILHYSAAPVVGGVESVIQSHARLLTETGHTVTVVAGAGDASSMPAGVEFVQIPELDTNHPDILRASSELEQGRVPENFSSLVMHLGDLLEPVLQPVDRIIVHNVMTKHFNLPYTAALATMLDQHVLKGCIAWCHDFTWTSAHSRSKVFPGYPWDLLRTYRDDITYVTISQARQRELAGLFGCPQERIQVIYNGVDPQELLGLSEPGLGLIERLGLWKADMILLMPVRVTQAKNIEMAIRLAADLRSHGIRPKLVLTGPPDPHDPNNMAYYRELLALRRKLNVEQEMCFVYESGPDESQPYLVGMQVVGDLYRVSDALFMPSRREGFGMPVVEAGLAGIPIFCAAAVPSAVEIGAEDVTLFPNTASPEDVAVMILERANHDPAWQMRRRMRQGFTWRAIFRQAILPLLEKGVP